MAPGRGTAGSPAAREVHMDKDHPAAGMGLFQAYDIF